MVDVIPKLVIFIIRFGTFLLAFQMVSAPTFLEHVRKSPLTLSIQATADTPVVYLSNIILGCVSSTVKRNTFESLVSTRKTSSPGFHTIAVTDEACGACSFS